MTCLEKYMIDNPHATAEEVIGRICPDATGGMNIEEPDYCDQGGGKNCTRCWNRPVPDAEPTIKDSGTRLEFSTGAVRDIQKGKGRCDLLPLDVVCLLLPENPMDFIHKFQESGNFVHLYSALLTCRMFKQDMPTQLLEVSKHFEEGAEKYGEDNWKKGLPVKCYINSAVRHYLKWLRGDTDERHDRAFCWNILCAIWTCTHKPELNEYRQKVCPVCSTTVPKDENECPHCRVYQSFDPDGFLGEYEEENE